MSQQSHVVATTSSKQQMTTHAMQATRANKSNNHHMTERTHILVILIQPQPPSWAKSAFLSWNYIWVESSLVLGERFVMWVAGAYNQREVSICPPSLSWTILSYICVECCCCEDSKLPNPNASWILQFNVLFVFNLCHRRCGLGGKVTQPMSFPRNV